MVERSIAFGKPMVGKEEENLLLEVLSGTQYVHGDKAKFFEQEFAKKTDVEYAISTSSCTAGLHLGLHIHGIKNGDKVIVPAMTHVATAHSVEFQNAYPVFIDIDPKTGNIDLDLLSATIEKDQIKAIIIVHYLGLPVDVHAIKAIAKDKDILIIEDCALAVEASVDNVKAGALGDMGCFSFYPVKHITTGEGGMITTNDSQIAEKAKKMKAFGYNSALGERKIPGIYDVVDLGYNYRMSEFHAAIGLAQIKKLDYFIKKRQENFTYLYDKLQEIEELYIPYDHNVRFQSAYYCLNILLPKKQTHHRNTMIETLGDKNIGVSVHYPCAVPCFTYYKEKYAYEAKDFPIATWYGNGSISLPVGPHLDIDDMQVIADNIKAIVHSLDIKNK